MAAKGSEDGESGDLATLLPLDDAGVRVGTGGSDGELHFEGGDRKTQAAGGSRSRDGSRDVEMAPSSRRRAASRSDTVSTFNNRHITVPSTMAPAFQSLQHQFSRNSCILHSICCMLVVILICMVLLVLALYNGTAVGQWMPRGGGITNSTALGPGQAESWL